MIKGCLNGILKIGIALVKLTITKIWLHLNYISKVDIDISKCHNSHRVDIGGQDYRRVRVRVWLFECCPMTELHI